MASFEVINCDVLDTLRKMEPCSFDGCLTDPPYALTAGKKGGTGEASLNLKHPGGRARITTGGFMGAAWDSDIPSAEVWAEVLRVLKPGCPLLAFGGTRTYHRLACAIEDGGFSIADTLCWLHGQGFPKGHAQLKPAWEPITLAWKKGKRALNIDGGRIASGAEYQATSRDNDHAFAGVTAYMSAGGTATKAGFSPSDIGRWPANVLLDPESAAALDAQSGLSSYARHDTKRSAASDIKGSQFQGGFSGQSAVKIGFGDSGGASRFFYIAKADATERHASGQNNHPCVKPFDLCAYLAKLILPPGGGRLIVPYSGSGSEIIGAMRAGWNEVIGIEKDPSYVDIARLRIYGDAPLFTEQAKGVEIERST